MMAHVDEAEHQRRNDAVFLYALRDSRRLFALLLADITPAERRAMPARLRNAGATAEELATVNKLLKETRG